jgi:hypothetical protein
VKIGLTQGRQRLGHCIVFVHPRRIGPEAVAGREKDTSTAAPRADVQATARFGVGRAVAFLKSRGP